jgi:hypothetical protein
VKGFHFGLTVLERSARLDDKIVETLIAMCLATANPDKRDLLKKELRAMSHWDRHKADTLLAAAL